MSVPERQREKHREVEIIGVSKWYGPVIGLNEVDLELGPGLTGLLGPNGAGKSTLMKLITGQLRPSIGEVKIMGRPVWRDPSARRAIGFSPDLDNFHEEMSGLRFVRTMARLSGVTRRESLRRALDILDRVGMSAYREKPLRKCSKGMRQRVKLAQALVHDPMIVVLDEPLTGVDPTGREELMALFHELRSSGKTVLISSHILEEVEAVTDQIVLIAFGRVIVSGRIAEIRELMDDFPLTVRVVTDRARDLAKALIGDEKVVSVAVEGSDALVGDSLDSTWASAVIRVRRVEQFFRELPALVTTLGLEIRSLEALDASATAIFDYLVNGKRGGPSG